MNLFRYFTVYFCFFVSYLDIGQLLDMEQEISDFEKFVKHVMKCKKIVGLGISLVSNNRVVYTGGFGYANIEQQIKVTDNSKFAIGSLTKAFTSAVIAKVLSENPRYTWETPIQEILGPNFKLFDEIRTEHVNLRDLLGHKLGTPGYFESLLVGIPENVTRKDLVWQLKYQQPAAALRTKFIYSNYFYAMAGYVVEQITGQTWENMVKEYLFEPLFMDSSGFVDQIKSFHDFALDYSYLQGNPVKLEQSLLYTSSPLGPAGSIYSTPVDMGKWMLFHLNKGKNSTGFPIVDNATLKETYEAQMATPVFGNMFKPQYPISDTVLSYNMGWLTSVYRGYKGLWHSGGIVGYSSLLWMFPDKKVGMFASITGSEGNKNSDAIKVIINKAADMLLGISPWLNETTACSFPSPWTKKTSPIKYPKHRDIPRYRWNISTHMSEYTGMYCNPAFGAIQIVQVNCELIMLYGRFGKMKLYPISKTEFNFRYIDKLWFMTHSDNNISPVRITFSESLEYLYYPIDRTYPNTTFVRNCNPSNVGSIVQSHNRMNCIHFKDNYLKTCYILSHIFIILLLHRW